ncbi:hypothetical protein AX15_002707 [Amanita polypyramis BW_CC]|nr:hypothetical protein AX15_002707 [Amanita polypyramis BW_CC]
MLGTNYPLRLDHVSARRNLESGKELAIYNTLTDLLPMSAQVEFFWRKLAKPFASMLETASFPPDVQCRFLTFVYARVIGMMGPHDSASQGSFMTFDGSPVELSWIVPKSKSETDRQIRFAIEPMDPRNGQQLSGDDVLDYLVSPAGSLGVVNSRGDVMSWRKSLENFLFPNVTGMPQGSKFFVGFDFAATGLITLKAYYIPSPVPALSIRNTNSQKKSTHLWDSDWTQLMSLMPQLHPSLVTPLGNLINFINTLDEPLKPRIEIFSVDCVASNANRLKIYCRPREGSSWADACRVLTLGGAISSAAMSDALAHLEILWNHLFPSSASTSGRQLEMPVNSDTRQRERLGKRNAQHPTGGLLYYFSLHPGVDMPLPKIYLPVSRYCRNDLQISNAVEQVYRMGERRGKTAVPSGWVAEEVHKAFDHRKLKAHTGIHTYVTLAYKGKGWEITSYFSPEVWA